VNELKNAYVNELYKMSKKKKPAVAVVLSAGAVIIAALTVYGINSLAGIRITGSSELSILVLSVLNYTLVPLFAAFAAIDAVSGEFADGTVKMTLTTPASRLCVYAAKALAIGTFIVVNLMIIMLLSLAASFFVNSGTPNLFRIFLAYLMSALPVFIFALSVMLIGSITRGTTSTFMFSILLFLVFLGLGVAYPGAKSFFFTSAFDWYRLFLGSFINYGKILRVFLILAGYGIMLFGGGYYLFDKRDI
jgi:ABC-2 type transport system permease protein